MNCAKFEYCRYGKLSTKEIDDEMSKEKIIESFVDFVKKEKKEEVMFENSRIENLSNNFFNRICGYNFYFGKFSYGEWKNQGEYFVGGYFYLISEKVDDRYEYVLIHQKYCEDDFDRFGVFILHKGFCDIYNSESEDTVKKKTLLISPSSFDEAEMLKNLNNISSISDIGKFVNIN